MELNKILKENYKISNTDFKVLMFLFKENSYLSLKEILLKVNKDRTTIQKVLQKLLSIGLIKRLQENTSRGFRYKYRILELTELKRVLTLLIDNEIFKLNTLKSNLFKENGKS